MMSVWVMENNEMDMCWMETTSVYPPQEPSK